MRTKNTSFWDTTARKYASRPIADPGGYERTLERTRHYLKSTDAVDPADLTAVEDALAALPAITPQDDIADLDQTIGADPTQAEVQAISDKVDALLAALRSAGVLAEA